jgi:hypothetical protein
MFLLSIELLFCGFSEGLRKMVKFALWDDPYFFSLRLAMKTFLEMVDGCAVDELEELFEQVTYEEVDYKLLGFKRLISFLCYIPDEVELKSHDGVLWAYAASD